MTQEPRTPIGQPRTGAIKVGSEILVHLGQGIYSTPANAIKELISNAYDADATRVTIRGKPDIDNVVVSDDGEGMNEGDFERHFAIVAKSFRREQGLLTPIFNRPVVGRFGIGFLAISQVCDRIKVISTKRGEPFRFEADIDFAEYRAKARQVAEYEYQLAPYTIVNYPEDQGQHYTIVILEGLASGFRDDLLDKRLDVAREELPGRYPKERPDFTGMAFEDIAARILTGRVADLHKELGGYWTLMMDLALISPVPYLVDGPVNSPREQHDRFSDQLRFIEALKDSVSRLRFTVDYDGVELRKPFLLPSAYSGAVGADEWHIDTFEYREEVAGQQLAFRGYLYNQRYSIAPGEFHGVVVRIKNTAVGGMKPDFLDYPRPEKLFFQQSMGEIYVDDGLEDAMNIDRATFRIGHPHYTALQNYLHGRLAALFRESRERYKRRRRAEEVAQADIVRWQLERLFGRPFEIRASGREAPAPVEIDAEGGVASVFRAHNVFHGLSAVERRMRASDLLLFEAASALGGDRRDVRDRYYRLLAERDGAAGT